jgi:hypothetical protein
MTVLSTAVRGSPEGGGRPIWRCCWRGGETRGGGGVGAGARRGAAAVAAPYVRVRWDREEAGSWIPFSFGPEAIFFTYRWQTRVISCLPSNCVRGIFVSHILYVEWVASPPTRNQ